MKFKKYQRDSYIAIPPHKDAKDELANWAVGLSEEVGEVNNILKHYLWAGEPVDKARLAEECGDVLWYLNAMCTVLGIDFNTVAELNIAKLQNRYPDRKFDQGRSALRKQLDKEFCESGEYKELIERVTD